MDEFRTVSGKIGRSAMPPGPVEHFEAEEFAIAESAIGDAGHLAIAGRSDRRKKQLRRSASNEILNGFVFIGSGAVAKLRSAVEATGATVSIEAPVFLECGQAAEVLFCVTNDRTFDKAFKTLRETCRAVSASGIVFFGEAGVPDQMSLLDLSRTNRLSGIALGSQHLQFSHQPEREDDQWVELRDLSRVCLGQDCPDIGPDFPPTVRLRIQSARLN